MTKGDNIVLNLDEDFDLDEACKSLEVDGEMIHRSDVRAIPAALIALAFYWIFLMFAPDLERSGFIPPSAKEPNAVSASPIPEIIASFVSFMLAIVAGLLVASARWYSFKAKDSMGAFTASIETLTGIIVAKLRDNEEGRKEGLKLLKYLCYSVLLFATKKEVVKDGDDAEKFENYYDRIIARLHIYADVAGAFNTFATSSAGLIRWTMARGHLAVVVRFGLRRGLVQMSILYFCVLFFLIVFDLWGFNSLPTAFASILVMVLAYLMAVLVSVAHNEANPIYELSGDGEYGLEGRLRRLIAKIDAQEKEIGYEPKGFVAT